MPQKISRVILLENKIVLWYYTGKNVTAENYKLDIGR